MVIIFWIIIKKMKLIDTMKKETWKRVYQISKDYEDSEYGIYLIISEFTGTNVNLIDKELSTRNDIVIFIPMITFDISDNLEIRNQILNIVKKEFYRYVEGHLPTTFFSSSSVKAKIVKSEIIINFENKEFIKKIIIKLSADEEKIFKNIKSFSLAVIDGDDSYIIRVNCGNDELPCFVVKKISITAKNFERELFAIIENFDKQKVSGIGNPDTFLDSIGSSSYDVYQSTENCESLPSLKNLSLGDYCYTCGKKETSREHCSPKWMTTKYKVKPLIGEIFCSECNSWFGKELERCAENALNIGNEVYAEQCSFIVKWCLKTALTMSLASGVNINSQWMIDLRGKGFPSGFEVYFDTRYRLKEKGFNYGVSRFNKRLLANNMFLFSFICSDFGFIVINKDPNIALEIPFHKFYPYFMEGKSNRNFTGIADLHQEIHEVLSNEKTEDFSLPIREQKK